MKTWAQINKARIPYIAYARVKTGVMLDKVVSDYVEKVREFGEAAIGMLSEGTMREKMESLYIDIYIVTGVAFAKQQIEMIKSRNKTLKLKEDWNVLETKWVQDMRRFAVNRCANKIQLTTRHWFKDIENVTRAVFAQVPETGWGADQVAKEIMKRQKNIDAFRALRIARTEIVGASNEGSFMGAKAFPIEVEKVWIATNDARTRPEHSEMQERHAKMSEKFKVPLPDGGVDLIDYPGDPDGQPENIINCRCGIVYEPVNSIIDQLLGE